MGQPPTGIGPGAIGPGGQYNPYAMNNSYTMAYGEDRDPYGAQMPYRIPYDTYNPNYPAIPGVANSFAPPAFTPGQNYMFYAQGGPQAQQSADETTPTAEPHASIPNVGGALTDYNMLYDRAGNNENQNFNRGLAQSMGNDSQGFDRFTSLGGMSIGDSNAWNMRPYGAANNGGMGQQAPIGTARPTSQGNNDFGGATNQQRQPTNLDFRGSQFPSFQPDQRGFTRQSDSANPLSDANRDLMLDRLRRMDGGKAEQVASRVHNVNSYLANLPNPAEMRADDMSRER